MATILPVYLPNISTDALIALLRERLPELKIEFERVSMGVKFRAPELNIILDDESVAHRSFVIKHLIYASRQLGATQLSIEQAGFEMRPRATDSSEEHIERLLIAMNMYKILKINLF